jgi:hypothetical protein
MAEFEIQKIHDTVWVFKNAIKDSEYILEYLKNNKTWGGWYTFGTMAEGSENSYGFNEFPTQEQWEEKINEFYPDAVSKEDPGYVEKTIDNLFYETTKRYLEENPITISEWSYSPWNIAKYEPSTNKEYAMHHHTDFQRELLYAPGLKFAITAVFYLNDNYDGGEVEFRFMKDETLTTILEDYSYKPTQGDIVVFLSGHPHYHGVRTVTSGEKYIIRTYWRYRQEAHPRWIEMQNIYGDAWEEMEKKRTKFAHSTHQIINNIPKFMDFEEYYEKLQSGELS